MRARPPLGFACRPARRRARSDHSGIGSAPAHCERQIEQRDCHRVRGERQHGGGASRQYYADPGDTQHGRTGGLCHPPGFGEHRVTRRGLLGGALAWLGRPLLAAPAGLGFSLTDVTTAAGIDFHHNSGAFGAKYLPETMGSGCAFFDYDGDGWLDILLVNGMDWPGHKRRRSTLQLYRNNRNGTFTDVTEQAGLAVEMYGMGLAVADYNNDGFPDVLVTAVGQNRLFQNTGKGHFIDVTDKAGLGGRDGFSTSALWFDFDRDGFLDLLVCNYVKWSPQLDVFCSVDGKRKSYCTPEAYHGDTCWLFRNRGNGTF